MALVTKEHWENIYQTKQPNDVSWTQDFPGISLEFIRKARLPKDARIIDVGGGDSKLVDYLLQDGYTNLTVLDISAAAIERAKKRLGNLALFVHWIVGDVLDFRPTDKYDCWHDRAAFHFQTDDVSIEQYLSIVREAVTGTLIIGTFSTDGPQKCSGLPIQQYDETSMRSKLAHFSFRNIECKREDHITPSGAIQNFVFCSFSKLN